MSIPQIFLDITDCFNTLPRQGGDCTQKLAIAKMPISEMTGLSPNATIHELPEVNMYLM
jgi:hypothetical protein